MMDFTKENPIAGERKARVSKLYKTRLLKIILLFTLIVIAIIIFLVVSKLPILLIKNVRIVETEYIDRTELATELDLLIGQSFFSADVLNLQTKIKKDFVFIDEIYIEKVFPDSIVVNVFEAKPDVILGAPEVNKCYLISDKSVVLDIYEGEESDAQLQSGSDENTDDNPDAALVLQSICEQFVDKYSVSYIETYDALPELATGDESTYYFVSQINDGIRVISSYKLIVNNVVIKNNVCQFNLEGGKIIRMDLTQDFDTQLKRFIVVITEMQDEGLDFTQMDVRFERPVIKR